MPADIARLREHLRSFDFKRLFVEELGWDRHSAEPLDVPVGDATYALSAPVHKRGLVVYLCDPGPDGKVPDSTTRRKIDKLVSRISHEHLIIYVDAARTTQIWQWVRREPGRPTACRERTFHRGQSGEALAQQLRKLYFELSEEDDATVLHAAAKVRTAFDVDRVTKRFYDRFKQEQSTFLKFVQGIEDTADREWYTSLTLNRLMFVYFIQKKGFLDGDVDYLRNRLRMMQARQKKDQFLTFYRHFLLRLFHEGLGQPGASPELVELLGKVPYLNGGLFDVHQLERSYPGIQIPDEAFERIFDFFDAYTWHLDDRPLRKDNEINPDVLGYIFEKYVNQKQMGAYYTKEDITEYIAKNTIIPFLFDAARKDCKIAFEPGSALWRLLQEDPDRYIYDAVRKGVDVPLPEDVAAGLDDVSRRGGWNRPADDDHALPTETWREHVARRLRCQEIRAKLRDGQIHSIDDLITYNLNIRQFAQDAIENCEGPELLRAFYHAIERVTVLDPTCGSGAFLFAALNVLDPLYDACLERMQGFLYDLERSGEKHRPEKFSDFRKILDRVKAHPNRPYFILKSIVVNNLYGVDIMEEAVEICKLRLFLKLAAQIDKVEDIEPLPDIDFNVRAGNTLVGFASLEEVRAALTVTAGGQGKLVFGEDAETLRRIEENSEVADRAFQQFHLMQTDGGMGAGGFVAAKSELRRRLDALTDELDRYLATQYGVDPGALAFESWRESHQPFHWFVEFYGIMRRGGFDVIIGNPPYVEYFSAKFPYTARDYETLPCANLYTLVVERCRRVLNHAGRHGMILPLAAFATRNMIPFIEAFKRWFDKTWVSFYHFRPSMLFAGGKAASIPTAIFIARPSAPPARFSTAIAKWTSETRSYLFEAVCYAQASIASDPINRHYYPKVSHDLENSILSKVIAQRPLSALLSEPAAENNIYYRSAGGLYWKVFVNFEWPYHTTSNKRCSFQAGVDRDVIVAVLNSSLFWWYYTVTFDTFNLKDYMLFGFRFSYPSGESVRSSLKARCGELMVDFKRHAEHLKRGGTGSYTIYARKSKPIIDEIDRVLAKHYGFTDGELDFIVNYDIKYRMGQDSSDDD